MAKSRRYSLLFTVNGEAFAVAKLLPVGNICAVLGGPALCELSWGMTLFTILLTTDIFFFGQHMLSTLSEEAIGPNGDTVPMFGTPGKIILILIGLLIRAVFLVGVAAAAL
jgi:hypothetical protein